MGWDALAIRNGTPLAMASKHLPEHWDINDLRLKDVFGSAVAMIHDKTGCVSECLMDGQLSGSGTRTAFERIFAMSFRSISDGVLVWSPQLVHDQYASVDW